MTVETISERLFKQHCCNRRISFRRIEENGRPVADFELLLGSEVVIAEVKQLDPNTRDRARETAPLGQIQGSAIAPSNRVRNLLADAYRQVTSYANTGRSCVIVCYNNAGPTNFIDNFTVTRAMFGGMAVGIALGPDGLIHSTGQGFTGARKVTRNTCRGLSALCVLSAQSHTRTHLVAYHNPYAVNPISPDSMRVLADSQFGYDDPHRDWNVALLAREIQV